MSSWTRIFFFFEVSEDQIRSGHLVHISRYILGPDLSLHGQEKKMEFLWQYWNKLKKTSQLCSQITIVALCFFFFFKVKQAQAHF
jgi:hypothetical protein